ncbi:MAG: histidinol dehydrogenase [Pseudomonadota bacterium]|nr:histidinol dehydrogenase [Pseudomonadota bacterium]
MNAGGPLVLRQLDADAPGFEHQFAKLIAFEAAQEPQIDARVASIVADVRTRGDAAVLEYTARFDRLEAGSVAALEITAREMQSAYDGLPAHEKEALRTAATRIRSYHERQTLASWSYRDADGSVFGQQVTPLDRVGLYVPGGKAAYPSSVLMNAIPAHVAGVREIVMVVPTPNGHRNALVLAAAHLAGVSRMFTIGGAQAIAALAYGTETIPAVDKICGPGNAYVAAAKRRVFGSVGIDMVAGVSEILVIADGTANPDWVAMDLFSQAEHDELAQAILITPDAGLLAAVAASAQRQIATLPRRAIIAQALANRGALVKVRDLEQACELANRVAPEHLELAVREPRTLLPCIRHAGAIFLGHHTSEALGDYCAGPNHVLPTGRTARFSSPLGVYDFQKRSSVLDIGADAARVLGRIASTLAHGEGLTAHARSAEYRVEEGAPAAAATPGVRAP